MDELVKQIVASQHMGTLCAQPNIEFSLGRTLRICWDATNYEGLLTRQAAEFDLRSIQLGN